LPSGSEQRHQGRQHQAQRDERDVDGDHPERPRHVLRPQVPGVDALADLDARVVAQLPVELAATDVECDHRGGAAGQQHAGEAAGRSADVEAAAPGRRQRERLEGGGELDSAARHPRVRRLDDRNLRVALDRPPRLVGHGAVDRDRAGEHERLRLRAGRRQAALHEQQVEPEPVARHGRC